MAAPQNPNSAKECALCHYRWIDTFFLLGKGTDLVPYQSEKVAAKEEMCLSCHDGSVADSRIRVFNDRHHPVNKPPPAKFKIPSLFPLDNKGNMQCSTCHTAHGVPSETGFDKTIFLRTSNENSAMCRLCHPEQTGGPKKGNHPIDVDSIHFPEEILKLGAVEGSGHNQVICESCHRAHGAASSRFLIEDSTDDGGLCLNCHRDKSKVLGSPHDLRLSGPQEPNIKGETPAISGVCGACHLVHGGEYPALWARNLPKGLAKSANTELCLSCHQHGQAANQKVLSGYSHPTDIVPKLDDNKPDLPFFSVDGTKAPAEQGLLTCSTCHDPHKGEKPDLQGGLNSTKQFLRNPIIPSPELCRQCHYAESLVETTDHDFLAGQLEFFNNYGKSPAESGTCGVCHHMHNSSNAGLWAIGNSSNTENSADNSCLSCHNTNGSAHKKVLGKRNHPVNIIPGDHSRSTSLPLFGSSSENSDKDKMTCLTCHNPHQWDPENNTVDESVGKEGDGTNSFLRLRSAPEPKLCSNCHSSQALVWNTDHDMNIIAPESTNLIGQVPAESGTCGVCHLIHNGRISYLLWARKLRSGNGLMDKMCKSCHSKNEIGAAKVPKADSHPDGMLITNIGRDEPGEANYFPLYHKKTGKKVRVGDISCASCHNIHQWDPRRIESGEGFNVEGKTTDSFLRMQTYSIMCIDCHGLDALFRFKYYHNSKQRGPLMD